MMNIRIDRAKHSDAEVLADIFWNHINAFPEYISHGEMQMGVGTAALSEDGDILPAPAENGREMWLEYINEKMESPDVAVVFKAMDGDVVAGFCVADIEEDGADPFGMVCDVLVKEEYRNCGIGGLLLEKAVDWLKEKGINDIYLESGKENHSAHSFFEKRGFRKVSEIFRLV
ncbi:MAG: GNAT family N-acetyltransferase [Candidatus Cryptobacteroides sp.]